MNKELFSYFFVLIALLVGALYYNNTIQSPLISTLNSIKKSYHSSRKYISDTIDQHFYQASEIEKLNKKLVFYKKSHLQMHELAIEIQDLYKIKNSPLQTKPEVELVRSISYQKFGNFNRLWIDVPEYNSSKIYGLTYKEFVAGIVINKNEKPLALLNQDIKSAYSVYVGKKNAPGITHGNNANNLVVNFIPTWFEIKVGDEVISSGLDKIFMKGLKVGKVLSVTSSQGYQNAIIEPYYKSNEPNYFYMIKRIK